MRTRITRQGIESRVYKANYESINFRKKQEEKKSRKIMNEYAKKAAKDLALLEERRKIDEQTRQRELDEKIEQEVYERSRRFQMLRNEMYWDLIRSLTIPYKGC